MVNNMDTNTIVIIIAIFAAQSVPLALFLNLSKKIDDMKDELSNFKIEVSNRLSKIENKLDITDERHNSTNEKMDVINQTTAQKVDKLEAELKEQRTEITNLKDKLFDFLKDVPKVAIH